MEERPPGTLVTTVKARDPENSPVSYSMSSLLDSRSQGEMLIKVNCAIKQPVLNLEWSVNSKQVSFLM